MRGKKPYNIRNVEAHIANLQNAFRNQEQLTSYNNQEQFANTVGRNLIFQTTATNVIQPFDQQRQNEMINAKFGVSKYASNLVSGKMFKKI
jgi:hypothetical protein